MTDVPPLVIADDYGLGADHDRVIRELLALGAISGTSVLVEHCDAERAAALAEICPEGAEIGLHLNLTLAAPGQPPRPTAQALLGDALRGRVNTADIRAAYDAQLVRFRALFGRTPDFLDGHQHAHAFPRIQAETVRLAAALPKAWTRSTVPAHLLGAIRDGGAKVAVVGFLGRQLRAKLRTAGLRTNTRFGGFLDLTAPDKIEAPLRRLLQDIPPGVVLMVHPGSAEDPAQTEGHDPRCRAIEAKILREIAPLTKPSR